MSTKPEITAIDEKAPYLKQVIDLAKENSATLGFLPKGAFASYAASRQILVALDDENNLLGYLLYATNRKNMSVYIVHLCIKQSLRHKGVARSLFDELRKVTKDIFRGIRVRCRRDYDATTFWPKLGFTAMDEMPGRSKQGTELTVWWFSHDHPTLFTFGENRRTQSKLRVVIDANVLYELQETPVRANEEVQSLRADWLQETVELYLTNETLNEINRHSDANERERGRAFASAFSTLTSSNDEFQKASKELGRFFPGDLSTSDESDLRQLAWSIAAGVQFFVTRDKALLAKSEDIYDNFGMRIIRPSDLVINQDQLMRDTEYQPARLAGSQIVIERVQSGQSSFLEETFRPPQGETKVELRRRLQLCLADPHTFETNIVKSAEQPLALIIYGRAKTNELEVPIFRVTQNTLSATLARYLVLQTILASSGEHRHLTKITDNFLSDEVVEALQENGFVFANGVWAKAALPYIETTEELTSRLASLSKQFPETGEYALTISEALATVKATENVQALLNIERALWPIKITDIDIPAFIVSIQPVWAMQLFDQRIASQDMFGAEPHLMFNVENVYYRSSHQKVLSAPARILWYVSKGAGKYQETMAIRACSYLDEVIIDKPKALFARFRRLGVYKWSDVFAIAKKDINRDIMAFRFSNTEIFDTPIHKDDLQEIWKEETGSNFHIQGPITIPLQRFFRLYKQGIQTRKG